MVQKGFSLVEVLVAITVLAIVGAFAGGIITNSFKGNTKSELIGSIKQNAQTALAIMEKDIRDAEAVMCPATSYWILTVLTKSNGRYIRFSMAGDNDANYNYIRREEFALQIPPANPALLCDFSQYPPSGQTDILDTGSNSPVKLTPNSGFIVTRTPGYKENVLIKITLSPGNGRGVGFENSLGGDNSFTFQTSVQLR